MECFDCPYFNTDTYCEKLGSKIEEIGCCEEEEEKDMKPPDKNKQRKLNGYERDKKYKRKLERIADCDSGYPQGAYRVDSDRKWTDDPEKTLYVKREYRGKRSTYLKKQAAKRFRRYKKYVADGAGYRRVFDFWWELT